MADSYKFSHGGKNGQYPENMVSMYDYMASRGGMYDQIIFVGLQYYIKEYLMTPVTLQEIKRVQRMAESHGVPFDYDGWMHILSEHGGLLPVQIDAVPEGTLIPVKSVQMAIESTDPRVPWVTGFIETLLMKTYYPTMVATKSYHIKQMLLKYGSPEWAAYALHNFGDRACHAPESAALSGYGHATQFMGTDNFCSLFFMEDYYNQPEGVAACHSVWASEHSSTTSNMTTSTREERLIEEEAWVYRMLILNPDRPIMSFVADSNDPYAFTDFCTRPGSRIRELIESRPHQKFMLRPDSGNPIDVLSDMLTIMLDNKIAVVPKDQGAFKLTFVDFGLLWGDGITTEGIEEILEHFTTRVFRPGVTIFAAENFIFGMGGGLATVDMHRDTSKYAVKCSSITVTTKISYANREEYREITNKVDVYKDPITDSGKTSDKGRVTTWFDTETKEYIKGIRGVQPNMHCVDILVPIFNTGVLLQDYTMEDIRAAA